MANTYTQIHIHALFSVQNRNCIIQPAWKEELYRYLTGIIQNNGHKLLAINGLPDHIHLLFGIRPTQSLSNLMQDLKGDSSKWINNKGFIGSRFSWQEGFGAFSYNRSMINSAIDYIKDQELHHRKKTFLEEYHEFLERFEVDFDERYLFIPVEY